MDIEKYVDYLYNNQNIGADETQKNLFKKEDYLKLVKSVLEVLKNNNDKDMFELRNILYDNSHIEEIIRDFFLRRKNAPGAVISYGTKNYEELITVGNKQEVIMQNGILVPKEEVMTDDTIFDLASTTKIFTALCVLKLFQNGEINLNDDVIKYVPEFKNLNGVKIIDLLTFEPLETPKKIDSGKDINEAEKILFDARRKVVPVGGGIYNDIAPMVLKYVIEKVSGQKYYDFLKKEILDKINMSDTFVKVPNSEIKRVANSNYDGRYYNDGNFEIRTKSNKGISTDDKARILGQPDGILSGHAGLFSTASDLSKLVKALIDNKILNLNIRDEMGRNRRGYRFMSPDNTPKYSQYFGMLCYTKNPILANSEIQHFLSGKSFGIAGWSGTQTTIDPVNNIYSVFLSNRSHNRMTRIDKSKQNLVRDNDGIKTLTLPNGITLVDSSRYAYDRDIVIKTCLELALSYKILEDITLYSKNNDKVDKRNRVIK